MQIDEHWRGKGHCSGLRRGRRIYQSAGPSGWRASRFAWVSPPVTSRGAVPAPEIQGVMVEVHRALDSTSINSSLATSAGSAGGSSNVPLVLFLGGSRVSGDVSASAIFSGRSARRSWVRASASWCSAGDGDALQRVVQMEGSSTSAAVRICSSIALSRPRVSFIRNAPDRLPGAPPAG